jgi:hypothetical protein
VVYEGKDTRTLDMGLYRRPDAVFVNSDNSVETFHLELRTRVHINRPSSRVGTVSVLIIVERINHPTGCKAFSVVGEIN